jgi:hypothetical protein
VAHSNNRPGRPCTTYGVCGPSSWAQLWKRMLCGVYFLCRMGQWPQAYCSYICCLGGVERTAPLWSGALPHVSCVEWPQVYAAHCCASGQILGLPSDCGQDGAWLYKYLSPGSLLLFVQQIALNSGCVWVRIRPCLIRSVTITAVAAGVLPLCSIGFLVARR